MNEQQRKLREVRERTGQGYLECRQALEEAGGDVARAVDLMRLRGETYTADLKGFWNARFKPDPGTTTDK